MERGVDKQHPLGAGGGDIELCGVNTRDVCKTLLARLNGVPSGVERLCPKGDKDACSPVSGMHAASGQNNAIGTARNSVGDQHTGAKCI